MTKTILAAVALIVVSGAAMAADSPCKGLDEANCGALAGCRWMAERVAGQTLTRAGQPAKTGAKAHCRKGKTPSEAVSKPARST